MTSQATRNTLLAGYREAFRYAWPCLAVFVSNRLLAGAVLAPAAGLLLTLFDISAHGTFCIESLMEDFGIIVAL